MSTFQKTTTLYKRVLRHILPFWPILMLGIVANVLFSGIDAGFTYLIKPFMNKGFIDKDLAFVNWVPLVIFVGIIARGFLSAMGGYWMTKVARGVIKDFRQQVFSHIIHLPVKYYNNATSGQLLSKLLYDVEQIAQVSADALTTFVQSLCLVIGLLSVMFVINWQLSSLFLLTVPMVGLIVNYTNKRTRRVSHSAQQSMGQVTEIASEAIDGYQVVRIFGGQNYEIDKFNHAAETSRRFDMKVAKIKVINIAGVQATIAIGIAGIILAAIHLSHVVAVTAGGFVSIIAAMLQLIKPLKNLSTVNSTIQRGLAGAESVFNLLDSEVEKDSGQIELPSALGHLSFEQVSFAYQPQKRALNDINLTINAGDTVALVGRSGGGKSTLVSLIARFYEPTSGRIFLDGHPLQDIKLKDLRKQIALVSQHITLFNDTIFNNIAYGIADVDKAKVYRAAQDANAYDFIHRLPQGFDTRIGENGFSLSGGQRQRIAIARAMLKNAPILILDEATSALDNESERLIQQALKRVMQDRTTIIIAHRLSTIEAADKIVVLDKGEIIEQGNHSSLLAANSYYAKLYEVQFDNSAVVS